MQVKPIQQGDGKVPQDDTGETSTELIELRHKFDDYVGLNKGMDEHTFKMVMGINSDVLATRIFSVFEHKEDHLLYIEEFMKNIKRLMYGDPQERLQFIFNIYDSNGDGFIDPDELKEAFLHSLKESNMELSRPLMEVLALQIFETMDTNLDGLISFEELWAGIQEFPEVLENITVQPRHLFQSDDSQPSDMPSPPSWVRFTWRHPQAKLWFLVFILANVACLLLGLYEGDNAVLVIARGTGHMLDLNMAMSIFAILRHVQSLLRVTRFSRVLLVDYHLQIHIATGYFVLVLSVIHAIAHLANIEINREFVEHTSPPPQYWEYLFTTKGGRGWLVSGSAYPTGVALLIILIVFIVFTHPSFRSKKNFWVFYATHPLASVMVVLGIFHSFTMLIVSLVPFSMYMFDKLLPFLLGKRGRFTFYVTKAKVLPSKVLKFHVPSPEGYEYQPGDYVYLCIPQISCFEWHMFAYSSTPFQSDELLFHIRVTGPWTQALYYYIENQPESLCVMGKRGSIIDPASPLAAFLAGGNKTASVKLTKNEKILKYFSRNTCARDVNLKIHIDGPYSSPGMMTLLNQEHIVIIAGGISVSAYVSMLQTIKHLLVEGQDVMIKRLDFIWVNRTQHAFEWFFDVLSDLQNVSSDEHLIHIQVYLSAAKDPRDFKSFALQMGLYSMFYGGERDVVSGLMTMIKAGRPDWPKVFDELEKNQRGRLHVVFSGPLGMVDALQIICRQRQIQYNDM